MSTPSDSTALIQSLTTVFHAEGEESDPPLSLDQMKVFLMQQIAALLDKNPGKLMSILYRIDVLEHKVKQAFETAPPGELSNVLSDLVINRQLQKLEFRQKYST